MAVMSMVSQVLSQGLSKGRQVLLRPELIILVAACSVMMSMEKSLSNVMQLSQVALLSYLCWKVAEQGQALWWSAQNLETSAEKLSHLEMRAMYENLLGHECVRQMYTWFSTYDDTVSGTQWFLDKIVSELACLRLSSLRRGQQVSPNCEALVFRYVRERIMAEHAQRMPGCERALRNWQRFDEWCLSHDQTVVVRQLGQPDPVRHAETTRQLENYVIRDDSHQYFWSFRG